MLTPKPLKITQKKTSVSVLGFSDFQGFGVLGFWGFGVLGFWGLGFGGLRVEQFGVEGLGLGLGLEGLGSGFRVQG